VFAIGPPQRTLRLRELAGLGAPALAQGASGDLDCVALVLGR